MKKVFILLLALAITVMIATTVMARISGSPHDISTTGATEICVFCHTPHGANTVEAPLWNRSQSAQTYIPFNSATFDMRPATSTLGIGSGACMVCHNGVTSSFINYPGPGSIQSGNYRDWGLNAANGYTGTYATWANLGTDLSNDHPVSFAYNPAFDTANDGNGFPAASGGWITGGNTLARYKLYGVSSNRFECATCHSVHDTATYPKNAWSVSTKNHTGTSGEVYFLRTTNASSKMCIDCHTNR